MKKIWLITLIGMLLGTISCSKDENEKTIYTVTFDADGGHPTPPAQQVQEGSPAAAPTTNPTQTGYVFMFWYISGATTSYNFQTPVNKDITLYARWQEEASAEYWQVAWVLNGGLWPSGENHATQVLKGGSLAEPAEPVKEGRTFEGWYKEAALTNKVSFPYDVSSVTADLTFYAKWSTNSGEPSANNHSISNAAEWNAAISAVNAAGNDKEHTFTITKSFVLPATTESIFNRDLTGLAVTIKGEGNPAPEISLANSSKGYLLTFYPRQPQRIILENITLKGHAANNEPLLEVGSRGELTLGEGARITGNTNADGYGGGAYISGTLIMKGGEISGNIAGTSGKTGRGGGVYLPDFGDLILESGNISRNTAYGQGGGVYIGFSAEFHMKGGVVSGNTAKANSGARGGGVYNFHGKLYMSGGRINGYDVTEETDADIRAAEHYSDSSRDDCNVVFIGITVMGTYGGALYSAVSDGNFYGVFDGETFNQTGSLGSKRERDLRVIDGELHYNTPRD